MPSIEPFEPQTTVHPWITEVLVAHTDTYIGKVLYYNPGQLPALQYHEHKDEAFYLFSGECWVDYDAGAKITCPVCNGGNPGIVVYCYRCYGAGQLSKLTRVRMYPGQAFHVPPGAVHRVEAITPCVMFEVSTPHFDDRVRVEERYK